MANWARNNANPPPPPQQQQQMMGERPPTGAGQPPQMYQQMAGQMFNNGDVRRPSPEAQQRAMQLLTVLREEVKTGLCKCSSWLSLKA